MPFIVAQFRIREKPEKYILAPWYTRLASAREGSEGEKRASWRGRVRRKNRGRALQKCHTVLTCFLATCVSSLALYITVLQTLHVRALKVFMLLCRRGREDGDFPPLLKEIPISFPFSACWNAHALSQDT